MGSARLSESEQQSSQAAVSVASSDSESTLRIEVAYATPEKQIILVLSVAKGIKPRDAIKQSSIKEEFPDIDLETVKMGVFGKSISEDYVLQQGDRIELYRPLLADPKEVRRRLAAEGKTMGKKKAAN